MSKGKYGKYFVSNPKPYPPRLHPSGEEAEQGRTWVGGIYLDGEIVAGSPMRISVRRVFGDVLQGVGPHKHDADEIFLFLATSPDGDLGSEIEVQMGNEGEKHTFNTTTAVYLPKGLTHAPIMSKIYDKNKQYHSIMIILQPDYTKEEIKR